MGILNTWAVEGYSERLPTSTHKVSLWYVPGGTEYTQAKVCEVFFDNEEDAKAFQSRYQDPPEMADLIKL